MDTENKYSLEILKYSFRQTEDIISLTDQKANILLVVHTVALFLSFDLSFGTNFAIIEVISQQNIGLIFLYAASMLIFISLIITSWKIVSPRNAGKDKHKVNRFSLIYFRAPLKSTIDDYLQKIRNLNQEDYEYEIAILLRNLANIANQKVIWVKRSAQLIILYTLFFVIGLLLKS